MTFPTVPTVAAGRVLTLNQLDSVATRTFPSLTGLTKNSGDLLIAIIAVYQSSAASGAVFSGWTAGWTEFVDQGGTTSNLSIGAAYKWSTGAETGTISVTQAATIIGDAAMILLSIPGVHATTPPEAGTIAHGTTAAADPGALNPAGWGTEDTLWIAVGANGMTSGTGAWTAMNAAPTNYTDYVGTNPADTSTIGDTGLAVAFRQLNAASEDPGPFGTDVSNARNSALLIAVRPPASATPTPSVVAAIAAILALSGTVTNYANVRTTAAVPAPGISTPAGTTITPATVAAVTTVGVAAEGTGTRVVSGGVIAVASVPALTATTGSRVTPATVTAIAAVPAPTVSTPGDDTAITTTVVAVAAVPAPTVVTAGNVTVAVTTVPAVAGIGAPVLSTGSRVTSVAVAGVTAVPAPTVQTAGNATITATTVPAVAGVGAMVGATGSTVTPSVAPTVAAVGTPVVITAGNATVTPTAVAGVTGIGAPTLHTGSTVISTAVAGVATVPAPTVQTAGNVTITTVTVAAIAGVPTATLHTGSTVVTVPAAGIAAVPAPAIVAGANVTVAPAAVAGVAAVPAPTLRTGAGVTPTAITGVTAVPAVVLHTAATIAPSTVPTLAAVGAVQAGDLSNNGVPVPNPRLILTIPAANLELTIPAANLILTIPTAKLELTMGTLTQGDTGEDWTGTCSKELGGVTSPANITGATQLALHVKKPSGAVVTKIATIVNGAAGTWVYVPQVGDQDEAGVYQMEQQVTYSNGRVQTFGPVGQAVQAQLA